MFCEVCKFCRDWVRFLFRKLDGVFEAAVVVLGHEIGEFDEIRQTVGFGDGGGLVQVYLEAFPLARYVNALDVSEEYDFPCFAEVVDEKVGVTGQDRTA